MDSGTEASPRHEETTGDKSRALQRHRTRQPPLARKHLRKQPSAPWLQPETVGRQLAPH